jgi:hypothetical protein
MMKTRVFLLFAIFFTMSFAEELASPEMWCGKAIEMQRTCLKIRNSGIAIGVTGLALMAYGIPLAEKGSAHFKTAGIGLVVPALGLIMTGGGLAMVIVGQKKCREYSKLRKKACHELSLNFRGNKVILDYRF